MSVSRPGFVIQVLTLIILITGLLFITFGPAPASVPCGGSGTTPATGSHDRGRTI